MFLSLDYLYVPAKDIEASIGYYTEQLGGELVWKIHAFNALVAAVRVSPGGPMVLLADHLHRDTPILIYRVARLETTAAGEHTLPRVWCSASRRTEFSGGTPEIARGDACAPRSPETAAGSSATVSFSSHLR